jgi:hypothetical protein
MKDIDDKDLVDVSGGGDRDPGANLRPEQDLNQGGGTGDETDDGNADGQVSGDGSQQHLG